MSYYNNLECRAYDIYIRFESISNSVQIGVINTCLIRCEQRILLVEFLFDYMISRRLNQYQLYVN